ncbi:MULTISPECIES: GTP cyclohydrolase I [Nocardioides]|uniref:GTP cyclohydrolase 1 n=1 Tax=Nocardioides vastitatis TaxID=2568655 RepID=A0ABW0ZKT8_9ACTN|nr:GTP cyclohydrolase I [Nocardioides sp.]THJ08450.1 GTP cyclohydrolase I [Nocardioides sp.]
MTRFPIPDASQDRVTVERSRMCCDTRPEAMHAENCLSWPAPGVYRADQMTHGHVARTTGDDIATAEAGAAALLRLMGRDAASDTGVTTTPARFVKAMLEMGTSSTDPADILGVTFDGVSYPSDQMVAVGPVPFVSVCEHHLLPFPGSAWIAYVPVGGRVVGLSKLPRLLDHFAAAPQVQERLTSQVTDAIMSLLAPAGAACLIRATHGCMSHRGVRKPGANMVTSVLRGVFKDDPTTRAEFLALTRGES